MKIVLDVSAAFAIVRGTAGSEWMIEAIQTAQEVIVPDLYVSEASNTAWKFFHIEGASLEDIHLLAQRSLELPDHITPSISLWEDALSLAHELDHPVYDCMYLVLAKKEGAQLMTLDKKLRRLAKKINLPINTKADS